MAVWMVVERGEYQVWSSCEVGDYANAHIVGIGDTFEEAQISAIDEILEDASTVLALMDIKEIRGT